MYLELPLTDDALTTFTTLGCDIDLGSVIEIGNERPKIDVPDGWVSARTFCYVACKLLL